MKTTFITIIFIVFACYFANADALKKSAFVDGVPQQTIAAKILGRVLDRIEDVVVKFKTAFSRKKIPAFCNALKASSPTKDEFFRDWYPKNGDGKKTRDAFVAGVGCY